MLIRIFKANNPVMGFSLLIVAALLWLPSFFAEAGMFSGAAMPFYTLVLSLTGGNKIASIIISLILVVGGGVLLNFIVQQFHLLRNQTYLPALLYVVLMSAIPEVLLFHPVLFANIFLLLALKRGLDTSGNANASSAAFDSAFFVSIASLFYFPAISFVFLAWVSLISFRSFSFRDWLISLMGVSVPYLFAGVYYYWFDQTDQFLLGMIIHPLANKIFNEIHFLKSFYVLIIFLTVIIVLSFPSFISEMGRNKASIRSGLRLFIWFGLIALLSYFLSSSNAFFHFCLAAIPLSIVFSNMFLNIKPVFAEIIFTALVFFMVIYHVNYF